MDATVCLAASPLQGPILWWIMAKVTVERAKGAWQSRYSTKARSVHLSFERMEGEMKDQTEEANKQVMG